MDAGKHTVLNEFGVEHGPHGLGRERLELFDFRKVFDLHAVEVGSITVASSCLGIK
ncbi:hypothetical protein D3C81_1169390 [compost metagenome]